MQPATPDQTPRKGGNEGEVALTIGRAGSLPGRLPSGGTRSGSGSALEQQSSLVTIGRLGLPRHTRDVLAQSALLTGMVCGHAVMYVSRA